MAERRICLDVVFLYAPPWSGPTRFSKHHLARHFACRGARVLYVEAPLTPFGVRRGAAFLADLSATLRPPHRVEERLWVRRHFLPLPYHAATPWTNSRMANRLGQRLLAPTIRRDLRRLSIRHAVLVAGLPHAADLVPLLSHSAVVYHCADDYAHVRGFPATLPRLEADLCHMADLVITTSETLRDDRRRFNPNTHWVPNGAEVQHFVQAAPPADDIRQLPRPIIGFVGGLSEWVDLGLIAYAARAHPDWSFVLVGPASIDISPIRDLSNVHLLGPRPYADLPGYLGGMDVGMIPFRHTEVTRHADPIKAYEYLAAGLPVVATDLPALHRLTRVVRLADAAGSFVAEIEAAVKEGRDTHCAERQTEAKRHSWTARFQTIDALLDQTLKCAS